MKLKFKSMEEIWQDHKNLLRAAEGNLPIDWAGRLPNDKEAYKILIRQRENWLNPREPIQLNNSKLEETLGRLIPQIENVWGRKMDATPAVELVAPEDLLGRVNHYLNLTNEMFGYGTLLESPPTMFLATSHKTLVLPTSFVARQQNESSPNTLSSESLYSSDFNIGIGPWDRAHLEVAISDQISRAMFRQARGEWGYDYVKAMREVGPRDEQTISVMLDSSAQIANERLCAQYPQWGLYVAADAITEIWGNRYARADYTGLNALSTAMPLINASMIDHLVFLDDDKMKVEFSRSHPSNAEKELIFDSRLMVPSRVFRAL